MMRAVTIAVIFLAETLLLVAPSRAAFVNSRTTTKGLVNQRSKMQLQFQKDTTNTAQGLYRIFGDICWEKLQLTGWTNECRLAEELATQSAVRNGVKVRATIRAVESSAADSPIRYARMALLESTPEKNASGSIHTAGIQVFNLVIFPSRQSSLPVWGADFVSLPGDKHLLLLDAQPMVTAEATNFETYWSDWYATHDIANEFPWGGDMPPAVQKYISGKALWTRFTAADNDPITRIQGPLVNAFEEHLDTYLKLLKEYSESCGDVVEHTNDQPAYIKYRVENDPARPMLKSLFGEEWTERVLHEVLFPQPDPVPLV